MKAIDYFIAMIPSDEFYTLKWFYSVMTFMPKNAQVNEYLKIEDNRYFVFFKNEWVIIDDVKPPELLIRVTDAVQLVPNTLENQTEAVTTNIGTVIANKILLASNFGNVIPFMNHGFKINVLEDKIARLLQDEVISVQQYIEFVNSASLLEGFSRITTVSSTPKGMLPPPNIKKLKKEIEDELAAKYGPNWAKTKTYIVEYEERLRAIDAEWLKDDPANGKLLSGKVKKEARTKQFLTFGADPGFDDKGNNVELVKNSLLEGFPEDKQQLTAMFNSARAGSYYRGKETQKGGSTAKDTLRATSAFTIVPGDCGSIIGKQIDVTKVIADSLLGRHMLVNNEPVEITNPEALIGKSITLRTPQRCKQPQSKLCSVCAGKIMGGYPNGISLLVSDMAGIILNSSMKKVHVKSASSLVFDIYAAMF